MRNTNPIVKRMMAPLSLLAILIFFVPAMANNQIVPSLEEPLADAINVIPLVQPASKLIPNQDKHQPEIASAEDVPFQPKAAPRKDTAPWFLPIQPAVAPSYQPVAQPEPVSYKALPSAREALPFVLYEPQAKRVPHLDPKFLPSLPEAHYQPNPDRPV